MTTSTITGVGSGFDIDSWVSQLVSAKQSSTVKPLETKLNNLNTKNTALSGLQTKFQTLKTSLEAFTKTIYGRSGDMWSNSNVTSSNDSYVTASTNGSVAAGDINLRIEQLATATTAKTVGSIGQITQDTFNTTKFKSIANGQAKTGTFSVFLNDRQYQIDIKDNDTLKDVTDKIKNATKDSSGNNTINATVDENGKLTISTVNADDTLTLGSSGDKSNFATVLKLYKNDGSNSYTSEYGISSFNADKTFASGESGIDGLVFEDDASITINGEEFKVKAGMSLNNLISNINGNSDVKVNASYDSLTNKFILTSTETGEHNISLSENGTNLLQKLGLTEADGDGEKLKSGSQTLGQNAIAYINGNKVVSSSNTITGEASGISNLSINIKKQTSEFSGDDKGEKEITLSVEPDYTEIEEALQTFVDAYNDVVTSTKSATASSGSIGNDPSLTNILSSIRGITSMVGSNDGSLSLLSQIGISTSSSDSTKLSIDKTKLEKSLKENFDSVKSLLSDGYESKVDNGLFDRLLEKVNFALDKDNGYFTQKSNVISSQISSMNTRIERANTQLTKYQERITKQFNNMDSTIAALNAQLSKLTSILG